RRRGRRLHGGHGAVALLQILTHSAGDGDEQDGRGDYGDDERRAVGVIDSGKAVGAVHTSSSGSAARGASSRVRRDFDGPEERQAEAQAAARGESCCKWLWINDLSSRLDPVDRASVYRWTRFGRGGVSRWTRVRREGCQFGTRPSGRNGCQGKSDGSQP